MVTPEAHTPQSLRSTKQEAPAMREASTRQLESSPPLPTTRKKCPTGMKTQQNQNKYIFFKIKGLQMKTTMIYHLKPIKLQKLKSAKSMSQHTSKVTIISC